MRAHLNRITTNLHQQAYDYVVNYSTAEHVSMSKIIGHIVLDAPVDQFDLISDDYEPSGTGHRVTANLTKEAYSIVQKRAKDSHISMSSAVERFILESEMSERDNY